MCLDENAFWMIQIRSALKKIRLKIRFWGEKCAIESYMTLFLNKWILTYLSRPLLFFILSNWNILKIFYMGTKTYVLLTLETTCQVTLDKNQASDVKFGEQDITHEAARLETWGQFMRAFLKSSGMDILFSPRWTSLTSLTKLWRKSVLFPCPTQNMASRLLLDFINVPAKHEGFPTSFT